MFLKSIELFGFKSFARRTKITFCDGITAILGQNGCGKSNVVDAVKWVTASSRVTRDLRISDRTDVIFGGTEEIPAMNMAEVTLTFGNEERQLLFDDDAVEVRRRLYRSGENEYTINGKVVSAKDLSELFRNTGIGKSAYSVMEQGRIDQVLSKRAEDRRYLFEEAAGISGAKVQYEEAQKNIAATMDNLSQLQISLSEMKTRYDALAIQAKKAVKWRDLKKTLFETDTALYALRKKSLEETKSRGDTFYNESLGRQKSLEGQIAALNDLIDSKMKDVTARQEEVLGLQKTLITAVAEKEQGLKTVAHLQKQLSNDKSALNTIELNLKVLSDRASDLEDERDDAQNSEYEKQKLLDQVTQNIAGYEKSLEAASSTLTDNSKVLLETQDKLRALIAKKDELQKELVVAAAGMVAAIEKDIKARALTAGGVEALLNVYKSKEVAKSAFDGENGDANRESLCNILEFTLGIVGDKGAARDKRKVDGELEGNAQLQKKCDAIVDDLTQKNRELGDKLKEYQAMMQKLKINEGQLQMALQYAKQEKSRLEQEIQRVTKEKSDTEAQQSQKEKEIETLEEELVSAQEDLAVTQTKGQDAQAQLDEISKIVEDANSEIAKKKVQLDELGGLLNKAREETSKMYAQMAGINAQIAGVGAQYEEVYGKVLLEEVALLEKFDDKKDLLNESEGSLKAKKTDASRHLESLGQVNLMAEGEFLELKQQYEDKERAVSDVKKALDDLERVAQEIKTTSQRRFMEAYNKISKGFSEMFALLMGGGKARLSLTNSEDVLSSGIEIEAEPPGKALQNLGLLSGGEKTMTAVALLFATYQAHPAPYCLLDEIDAALDDKNVTSFAHSIREFSQKTQYIVITHNKKTALAADSMFGVSMPVLGVSSVVSLRFSDYEDKENV